MNDRYKYIIDATYYPTLALEGKYFYNTCFCSGKLHEYEEGKFGCDDCKSTYVIEGEYLKRIIDGK